MKQVAALAGVSVATVSRVVNRDPPGRRARAPRGGEAGVARG
jgi:DNA-binding LacI/PurR family transcriptional regulator